MGLDQHLTIDLGEIRGFDYYSGILFRAYVRGLGFEVASGGRYDGLPAQFGHDTPAVGFSFSLDRLEQIVDPKAFGVEIDSEPGSEKTSFEEAVRLRREGRRGAVVLVIAIAKGRFLEPSLDLLARAGIEFEEDVAESRRLISIRKTVSVA